MGESAGYQYQCAVTHQICAFQVCCTRRLCRPVGRRICWTIGRPICGPERQKICPICMYASIENTFWQHFLISLTCIVRSPSLLYPSLLATDHRSSSDNLCSTFQLKPRRCFGIGNHCLKSSGIVFVHINWIRVFLTVTGWQRVISVERNVLFITHCSYLPRIKSILCILDWQKCCIWRLSCLSHK